MICLAYDSLREAAFQANGLRISAIGEVNRPNGYFGACVQAAKSGRIGFTGLPVVNENDDPISIATLLSRHIKAKVRDQWLQGCGREPLTLLIHHPHEIL